MVFCWHVSVGPSLRVQSSYRSFMFFKRSGQRNPRGGGGGGGGSEPPVPLSGSGHIIILLKK